MKKLLVCCEESQTICKAFRNKGYIAFSCDLKECSGGHPEWHIKDDCFNLDFSDFEFVIAHPPCTYLTSSQPTKLFLNNPGREDLAKEAADFFMRFYNLNVSHLCIENPVPLKRFGLPNYTQIIQPYNFGHPFSKRTCLWLRGLPILFNTCLCDNYKSWVFTYHDPVVRAKTFPGIAKAMADQWGFFLQ